MSERGSAVVSEERLSLSCPVCGEAKTSALRETRDHWRARSFILAECAGCSMLYLQNPPIAARLAEAYDNEQGAAMRRDGTQFFSFLQRQSLNRDLAPALKHIELGSKILDFGAGSGVVSQHLYRMGYQVKAVDMAPRKNWLYSEIEYKQVSLHGDALLENELFIEGKPFDLVVIRHVLEHLLYPSLVLETLRRTGAKFVLIVVPNVCSPWARILGDNWFYWDPPRHVSFFKPKDIHELARRTGFSVVRQWEYGIDELVVSLFRKMQINLIDREGDLTLSSSNFVDQAACTKLQALLGPKSTLAAISSALSFWGRTVVASLLRINE